MKKHIVFLSALLTGMLFAVPVMAEYIVITEPIENYSNEYSYSADQYTWGNTSQPSQEKNPQITSENIPQAAPGNVSHDTSESSPVYTPDEHSPFAAENIGIYSGMMSSLYRFINGNSPVSAFSIRAKDLTSAQKAFVLYYYQYNCDDSRIQNQGEFNCAYILDMQDIMNELFYNATTEDMQYFEQNYVENKTGELYYMPGSGDFGDAGTYYFNNSRIVESSDDYITISGDVLEYNNAQYAYLYSDTYWASFKIRTLNGRTCYSFEDLTIGSGAGSSGSSSSSGYSGGSGYSGSSGYSDTYGVSGYDGSAADYSSADVETESYLSGLALDYFERHYNHRPEYADVEDQHNGTFIIHLYDFIDAEEGGHTVTSAWYLVDYTGYGSDWILGDEINLLE